MLYFKLLNLETFSLIQLTHWEIKVVQLIKEAWVTLKIKRTRNISRLISLNKCFHKP